MSGFMSIIKLFPLIAINLAHLAGSCEPAI